MKIISRKKILTLCICFSLLSINCFAQKNTNSSQNSNTSNPSQSSEVESHKLEKNIRGKRQGWELTAETGMLIGKVSETDNNLVASPSFSAIVSYCFSPYFTFGLGTSINNYTYPFFVNLMNERKSGLILPIYGYIRTDFLKNKKATPFVYGKFGHGFPRPVETNNNTTASQKGGFMYGGGVGLSANISNGIRAQIGVGYLAQNSHISYTLGWDTSQSFAQDVDFNRIQFNVGLSF